MNEPLTFPSKRDFWLVAVLWLGAGIEIVVALVLMSSEVPPLVKWLAPAVLLAVAVLIFWVLYGTYYSFQGDTLVIRCGPFRFRVSLAEIESVTPTRNPLSSPACSLDRLLIQYRQARRWIMVSPDDKIGFFQALAARCSHLVLVGDRLVRKGEG